MEQPSNRGLTMKSKPIQITEVKGSLHALCSDGSIWVYNNEWVNIFTMDKKAPCKSTNNIKARQDLFYNTLKGFTETYDNQTLRAFFNYWSEPNQAGNKMRCQLEKTWDVKRRLENWSNRSGMNSVTGVKAIKNNTPEYNPDEYKSGLEALKRSGQLIELTEG